MSARAALVDRLTERVSKDLRDDKINALTMDSSTTTDHKLRPTRENGEEAKSKDCDYILLTQIVDPKTRPFDPQSPQISIGGKVPSIDASDPLGGSSVRFTEITCKSASRYFPRTDSNPWWIP